MALRGHFDGEKIVLDEPVPQDLSPDTPVTIEYVRPAGGTLQELARMAQPCGLPTDFSEHHSYYTKGAPRR